MSKSLYQKNTFKSFEYSLDDTGLLLRKKSIQSELELHFSFEQIRTNKASEVEHNKFLLVSGCLSAFFAICVFLASFSDKTIEIATIFIWSIISISLLIFYFTTRTKKTYLYTTENKLIEFYADKPNAEAVAEFIDKLLTERNIYLASKYGNPNKNLEYGPQLDNLNWLLNTKAISKATYDDKLKELNSLFSGHQRNNPIGFSPKS